MGRVKRIRCWWGWRSWTMWFNIAAAVFSTVEANLHMLEGVLGPYTYLTLAGVIAGINALLRIRTSQRASINQP